MGPIEVGVVALSMAGEPTCADRHVVRTDPDEALVAALDGIGHGHEAERAALEAVRTLEEQSAAGSLVALVTACHARLQATRGVVMSLASIDLRRGILTWLGVGNVAGVLFRARTDGEQLRKESLLLRGGVVGHRLPPLRSFSLPLGRGDTLVFATDGVDSAFDQEQWALAPPQRLAEQIMSRHGKGTDDALVLVVRYLGAGP